MDYSIKRPIIIGRKNNHAASYYLSKHTNLLPNININNDNDKGEKRKANNYLKNDEVIIKKSKIRNGNRKRAYDDN